MKVQREIRRGFSLLEIVCNIYVIDCASLVAREGGNPDYAFMNFTSFAALEKSLGSKVQYVSVKHDQADISFKGIVLHAPYGEITVLPDRNCQQKRAYVLQMDTWQLRSLNRAPHILTYGMEGLEALRQGTADALEVRIGKPFAHSVWKH